KGRNALGALPRPSYTVQDEGIVVVDIWVDNYGNVTKAVPGAKGTTVNNQSLWAAARAAAMKAHFNQSADAPALQQGTITYIFKLK
ncbi:MAG: TonB family protein, partial [Candidatus Cryptobacteroides sp.]